MVTMGTIKAFIVDSFLAILYTIRTNIKYLYKAKMNIFSNTIEVQNYGCKISGQILERLCKARRI